MTTARTWREAWLLYSEPRVITMFFLGFSAGLPLLLVFGTLSAWLRDIGIDRSTIGYVSWVALLYGLKFAWAPLVDRLPLPGLTAWLGHRRSWMLLAQGGVVTGLLIMAHCDPTTQLTLLVFAALLTAFSSATQDISIDAWRIEAAPVDWQGAMAATYQIGYRLAMIVAGAAPFYIADAYSWSLGYIAMAVCMSIGVITTLLIFEPDRQINEDAWMQEARVTAFLDRAQHLPPRLRHTLAWFIGAVVCPFTEFFARNRRYAWLILLFIGVFRLSDITLGVMANPFYIDMGYSKSEIATVTKVFGPIVTIAGAVVGGVLVARLGALKMLLISALMVTATNLIFAWLAQQGPMIEYLVIVISADNLSAGVAGSSFIAYLSGLTNKAYTATQYALFSSLMLLPAKFVAGFSGAFIDAYGYISFFIYAASLGLPAILLTLYFLGRTRESRS